MTWAVAILLVAGCHHVSPSHEDVVAGVAAILHHDHHDHHHHH